MRPEGIPLWIGGAGERVTLRQVAARADGWNTFLMPLEEYRHKLDVLERHCESVDRDPGEIRLQLVTQAVLGADRAEVEDQLRLRAEGLGLAVAEMRERALALTPGELVERLAPFAEMGVKDFLVMARPPMDRRTLELLAGEVAGEMRRR